VRDAAFGERVRLRLERNDVKLVYQWKDTVEDVFVIQGRARVEHASSQALCEQPGELDNALVEAGGVAPRERTSVGETLDQRPIVEDLGDEPAMKINVLVCPRALGRGKSFGGPRRSHLLAPRRVTSTST
jgi:hypothetical protein